jgi:cob(I)alamin adenosyltransferase
MSGDLAGSFIIYYGPGKGKTTSAIGLAIRAAGHGQRTAIIQFIKSQICGEHRALARLSDLIEVQLSGTGFMLRQPPSAKALEAAAEGMKLLRRRLTGGKHAIVIGDELLGAIAAGLVSLSDVEALADARPPHVTLVLTGREAPPSLLARADLVSRIEAVKHPYDRGLEARPGIEY